MTVTRLWTKPLAPVHVPKFLNCITRIIHSIHWVPQQKANDVPESLPNGQKGAAIVGLPCCRVIFRNHIELITYEIDSPYYRHGVGHEHGPHKWFVIEHGSYKGLRDFGRTVLDLQVFHGNVFKHQHTTKDVNEEPHKETVVVLSNTSIQEKAVVVGFQVAFAADLAVVSSSRRYELQEAKQNTLQPFTVLHNQIFEVYIFEVYHGLRSLSRNWHYTFNLFWLISLHSLTISFKSAWTILPSSYTHRQSQN